MISNKKDLLHIFSTLVCKKNSQKYIIFTNH